MNVEALETALANLPRRLEPVEILFMTPDALEVEAEKGDASADEVERAAFTVPGEIAGPAKTIAARQREMSGYLRGIAALYREIKQNPNNSSN